MNDNEFTVVRYCKKYKNIYIFRQQWTRAVVLKLFIEHVCTSGKEDIDIKRCMPLWTVSMIIIKVKKKRNVPL